MTDSVSTAELVTRYAARFDAVVGATGHTVSSPLGAWLLVALAAPLTTGDERAATEEVLGTTADDAYARAEELLARPHVAVAHAVAVWHRPEWVRPAFAEWTRTLTAVETGPVPSPKDADAWAAEHTNGLVERFPVVVDGLTAILLASALAAKVRWTTPFQTMSSRMLGDDPFAEPAPGSWSALVRNVLLTPDDGHDVGVFSTTTAGLVAVHAVGSADGLLVVSVLADPAVHRTDVRAAAHEVATALVTGDEGRVAIADLPLGPGAAWTVSERAVDVERHPAPEVATACLPAWSADAHHDLRASDAPGVGASLTALAALVDDSLGPVEVRAGQGACARYAADGFEAAAVTALAAGFRGGPPPRTHTQRLLAVRFDRPYAVVAVARDDAAPTPSAPRGWHGVPVFSAWIEEPTEAGPV